VPELHVSRAFISVFSMMEFVKGDSFRLIAHPLEGKLRALPPSAADTHSYRDGPDS
jgi:hypothetical protein